VSAILRLQRRQRAKNDIWFFTEYYFPHILKVETPQFHREIVETLQTYNRVGIAAPRGYAKSTILFTIYALHCLLFNEGEDILLVSQSDDMAVDQLRQKIKFEFEQNDKLFDDFSPILSWGDKESRRWTTDHLIIYKPDPKGHSKIFSQIRAKGRGCQVRGFRPSKVICDDLEDDELVKSEEQRQDLKNWFLSALFNVMRPEAQIVVIGTILHPLSLLADIVRKKEPFDKWHTKIYKALLENDVSLWEKLYPTDRLLEKRREIGTYSFEKEYQNNPISSDVCLWKPPWIKRYDGHHKPVFIRKMMAMDIAGAEKQSADYSAICCVGETEKNTFYEIETIRGHWGTWDLVHNAIEFYLKHKPIRFGIEEQFAQQILKPVLLREARKRGISLPLMTLTLGSYSDTEKKTRTPKDKYTRAMSVIHFWENGQVFMKTDSLIEETMIFPTGGHDDMVDAMVYCMRMFLIYGAKAETIQQEENRIRPTSFEIKDNTMPNLVALDEEYYKHLGADWRLGV